MRHEVLTFEMRLQFASIADPKSSWLASTHLEGGRTRFRAGEGNRSSVLAIAFDVTAAVPAALEACYRQRALFRFAGELDDDHAGMSTLDHPDEIK
jgi:hypothetical protein